MRKALVVGIDHYSRVAPLHGCVSDAHAVRDILETHGDGSVNFGVKALVAQDASSAISRGDLKDAVRDLFSGDSDIALLYFAGHGYVESTGGYLCASDCERGDDGLSLNEIVSMANSSRAKNRVVILDSCHSGIAGDHHESGMAELKEGMTVLTASTQDQYATEQDGSGVFTSLLVDALSGAAANLVGAVTPGSVYAHIDQSLGPWEQRPVFKTNVKTFVSLRTVPAAISLEKLRRLPELFPTPGFEYPLDPSYEPEMAGRSEGAPPPDPANNAIFAILQAYQGVNLVRPVGAPHMWHAAMESKSCQLTVLGEHYRRLVQKKRI
jgi:hypothetical protein